MNKKTSNYFTVSIEQEFHRALAGEVQFRASHSHIFMSMLIVQIGLIVAFSYKHIIRFDQSLCLPFLSLP